MKRLFLSLAIVLSFAAQAFAGAAIEAAFSTFTSVGGKVNAGKTGTNTLQVVGATLSKVGGKPTMTINSTGVDVRDYGAKGDNKTTSATTNKSAIQAALNAAASRGLNEVFAPAGTYYVDNSSGPLQIPVGVTLKGAASYWNSGTQLLFTDVANDDVEILSASDGGFNGIENLWIQGGKRGVYAHDGLKIHVKDVYLSSCVVGFEIDAIIYSRFEGIKTIACGTGAYIHGHDTVYSDQNSFIGCYWNGNTGWGMIKQNGQGNTFISNTWVYNQGGGLLIEDNGTVSQTDGNFLWLFKTIGPDTYTSPYLEDVYGGGYHQPVLKIVNAWNQVFINATIINYDSKPDGVISLFRTGRVKISGASYDFATNHVTNFLQLDRTSYDTDVDILGQSALTVFGEGINSKINSRVSVQNYKAEADTLANAFLDTAGSSGNLLSGWIAQGASDMALSAGSVLPGITQHLTVTKGSPATNSNLLQQTVRTLTAGGKYYLNIVYSCDSVATNPNAPMSVSMQNATGGYTNYDFVTGTWNGSGSAPSLYLPMSSTVNAVSIPFTAPTGTPSTLAVYVKFNGSLANGAVYQVYYASIDTVPNTNSMMSGLKAINKTTTFPALTSGYIPFAAPDQTLKQGNMTYNATYDTLNVGTGTATSPTVMSSGTTNANLELFHSGAVTDLKTFLIRTAGGLTKFSSLTDGSSFNKQGILTLNHSTGTVSFGFAGSVGKAMCWKSDGNGGVTPGYCSTAPDGTGACTCN